MVIPRGSATCHSINHGHRVQTEGIRIKLAAVQGEVEDLLGSLGLNFISQCGEWCALAVR